MQQYGEINPFKMDFNDSDFEVPIFPVNNEATLRMFPPFTRDVFTSLLSMRETLESSGLSLTRLSEVIGIQSNPEGDQKILNALNELVQIMPGLRYVESEGLVYAGGVLK